MAAKRTFRIVSITVLAVGTLLTLWVVSRGTSSGHTVSAHRTPSVNATITATTDSIPPDEGRTRPAVAALERIARDPTAAPETRREAVLERARLLGIEVPTEFADRPVREDEYLEIPMPAGPPAVDTLEPGQYVLVSSIEFSNDHVLTRRQSCRLTVTGESFRLSFTDDASSPITGTIVKGRILASGHQDGASFELAGKAIAPTRAVGTASGGFPAFGVTITRSGWSLELAAE